MTEDYATVKIIKPDGEVEFKRQDEFPRSKKAIAWSEYMKEYGERRRANHGGPITLFDSNTKLYLSEMPHMGGGS